MSGGPRGARVSIRGGNTRATVRPRSLDPVRPDELERQLRERLDALGPAPRAEPLHVLLLPDFDRADRRGIHRSRALILGPGLP